MSAEGGNIEILIKQRSELNVLNLSLKPSCFRGIFSSFAWTLLFVFLFLYDMTSDSFPSRLYDLYVFKLNPIHVLTPKLICRSGFWVSRRKKQTIPKRMRAQLLSLTAVFVLSFIGTSTLAFCINFVWPQTIDRFTI